MKKFIGPIVVAMRIASPVFAQSFDADNGTANLIAVGTPPAMVAPLASRAPSALTGEKAYAFSARRKAKAGKTVTSTRENPAGGSIGYNAMLQNY